MVRKWLKTDSDYRKKVLIKTFWGLFLSFFGLFLSSCAPKLRAPQLGVPDRDHSPLPDTIAQENLPKDLKLYEKQLRIQISVEAEQIKEIENEIEAIEKEIASSEDHNIKINKESEKLKLQKKLEQTRSQIAQKSIALESLNKMNQDVRIAIFPIVNEGSVYPRTNDTSKFTLANRFGFNIYKIELNTEDMDNIVNNENTSAQFMGQGFYIEAQFQSEFSSSDNSIDELIVDGDLRINLNTLKANESIYILPIEKPTAKAPFNSTDFLNLGFTQLTWEGLKTSKNSDKTLSAHIENVERYYRGSYLVHKARHTYHRGRSKYIKTHWSLINFIDMQSYLKSVVPSEVSASWDMESLKAQVVSAKTYALSLQLQSRIYYKKSYDMVPTHYNQVYQGVIREHEKTNLAVDATRGEVMLHNGKPITAMYHARSGRQTKSHRDQNKFPYLSSVPNPIGTPNAQQPSHQMGLCQVGALKLSQKGLAQKPQSEGWGYRDILRHYYPTIDLVKISDQSL